MAHLIVASRPAWVSTWGVDCEVLHDAIDAADIAASKATGQSPEEGPIIMTTWHDKESLEENIWFFKYTVSDPSNPSEAEEELTNGLILHITSAPAGVDLLELYGAA